MKCETCRYWCKFYGSKEKGQCRRWAPELVAEISGGLTFVGTSFRSKWPETVYTEWCGEYLSHEEPKKEEL